MADFSQPIPETNYLDVLTRIREVHTTLAKMFDGTVDTNIPTGALRYDSTNRRLSKWDGGAWAPVAITGLDTDSVVTASITNNAVTEAKFRGTNNAWLRWRNVANNADINVLNVDSSNDTNLYAGGALIKFGVAGILKWQIGAGALLPALTDTFTLGDATRRVYQAYVQEIKNCNLLESNGAVMNVGPFSAHDFSIKTSNTTRWTVNATTGDLSPAGAYDIGKSTALVNTVFAKTVRATAVGQDLALLGGDDAYLFLGCDNASQWCLDWVNAGTLRPLADNTVSLGLTGYNLANLWTNRIRNNTGDLWILPGAGQTALGAAGVLKFSVDASSFWPMATGLTLGSTSAKFSAVYSNQFLGVAASAFFGTDDNQAAIIRQNGLNRIECLTTGFINLANQTVQGTAGALSTYLRIFVNGTSYKIPLYLP